MCNREMIQTSEPNEVMAFKYHYISFIAKEVSKCIKNHEENDENNHKDMKENKKCEGIEKLMKICLKNQVQMEFFNNKKFF